MQPLSVSGRQNEEPDGDGNRCLCNHGERFQDDGVSPWGEEAMEQARWGRDDIISRIGVSSAAVRPEERLGARHLAQWKKAGIAQMEICEYAVPTAPLRF